MTIQAGLAEIEITPKTPGRKIGWIKLVVGEKVIDPLYARACVLRAGDSAIGIIQLDTLSIRAADVDRFRQAIRKRHGIAPECVMVAATHNHAGPAVSDVGEVERDMEYVEFLAEKVAAVFDQAVANLRQARIGLGHGFEFEIARNRRVVMRDGTVRTHHTFKDPDSLHLEGPIDPEVAVLALRSADGAPLGTIVNYACHPTHHGSSDEFSAGYPGVLAAKLKAAGWPVAMFLNGACGNLHDNDPFRGGTGQSKEHIGQTLAQDALAVIAGMTFTGAATVAGRSRRLQLPFRKPTQDEITGTIRGAQRFIGEVYYDRDIPLLLEKIRRLGAQPAEVQVLSVGDWDFVAIPAEYFVENGLKIKLGAFPRHAVVVSCANGMVGYVPHAAAFDRGGYETTFWSGSRLAPPAGDMLADCAIELIKSEGRRA